MKQKQPPENWNPEQAGEELKALFDKADEILSKPIYHAEISSSPKHHPPKRVNGSNG